MGIKQSIYGILKGSFLVDEDAYKNWMFILFLAVLSMLMISSAHSVDRKVQKIAKLNRIKKELRAEFVATGADLMRLKMQSGVVRKIVKQGLYVPDKPPIRIKVN